MSDLAATNCGCNNDCGCGCNNGCGCGNDCGCGNGTSLFGGSSCNCILWIIILMCCCGNNGCGNGCGCGNNDNCWIIVVLLLLCDNNGFGCGNGPPLSTNYSLQTKSRGSFPLPLSVSFCPSLFFSLHIFPSMLKTFQVQFIKSISVQHKLFFFIFHGCCLSDLSYYLSYVKSSSHVII